MRERLAVLAVLLVVACGDESSPGETGSLSVAVTTTGLNLDSGYALEVDGQPVGAISANETRQVGSLSVGTHQVRLNGIATNCSYGGTFPAPVSIERDEETTLALGISCGATGTIRLVVSSTGSLLDQDGYFYGLDQAPSHHVAINDTVLLPDIRTGEHTVALGGLAPNCRATPEPPSTVTVVQEETAGVLFLVTCETFGSGGHTGILFLTDRTADGLEPGLHWWAMDSDGGHAAPVDWFPLADEAAINGGVIAFTRDGNLFYTSLEFGFTEQVTFDGGVHTPALAPNDVQVTYSRRVGDSEVHDLMVLDLNTNLPPQIVGSSATDRVTRRFSPAWIASETRIAFGTDSSINSIRPDGTDEQLIIRTNGPVTHLDWSHRSRRFVFNALPAAVPAQFGSGAWVANDDGTGLAQVLTSAANVSYERPRWNGAGDRLAFSRIVAGSSGSTIWTAKPDGSEAVEVSAGGSVNLNPVWW